MNRSTNLLSASLALVISAVFGAGCAPGAKDLSGGEQVDADHAAFTSAGTAVGDWNALPSGMECLEGMQSFYPAKFGVRLPIAPESWYGDCAPEGACHLWLDAQPDPAVWERISTGTPSTYDLIVYPPIGNDPWGHVAAVDHVENGQIYVMDDNYVAHHVRSSTPHTVDWPAYGWYHLRSLPQTGDVGGNPDPGVSGSCKGLNNGLYCGSDYVNGDAGTLYKCSGGAISVADTCAAGCQVMPNGSDDRCADGGGSKVSGSCQGFNNGLYCGEDHVGGDTGTLYKCSGGDIAVVTVCAAGCQVMPDGSNDRCN